MLLPLLLQFVIGFLIGLSGALLPGPLLAFVVSDSMRRGWRSGPLAATGHCAIESALMLGIFGLAIVWSSPLARAIGIIGGIALIGLGLIMMRDVRMGRVAIDKGQPVHYSPVVGGIAFTALNPTWIPWWLGTGLAPLVDAVATASVFGGISWCIGHFCSDFGWYGFVSASVSKGRRHVGTKGHKAIIVLCAFFVIALGLVFLIRYAPAG